MVVINQTIPDEILEQLSYLVSARFGLYFPRERWPDLENGLAKAIKELGYENVEVGAQALLNSNIGRTEIEILAGHLTIGETYFYRDQDVFKAMEEEILPTLIARRANNGKYLRIWSAGCATGEEPYSIAIAISRVIPDLSQWNIRILATDINDTALRKAAEGIYGKWSFRGFPPEMQSRYFLPQPDGRFRVIPEIKRLVNFEYHNLAEDPYPALLNQTNAQDIIFCRNALMYFSRNKLGEVINRFCASLVGDGFLIVSPNDIPPDADSPFTQEMRGGAIYFSKNIHKNRTQILPSSNHPTDISFPEVEPFADRDERDFWYDKLPYLADTNAEERKLLAAVAYQRVPEKNKSEVKGNWAEADRLAASGRTLESMIETTKIYDSSTEKISRG